MLMIKNNPFMDLQLKPPYFTTYKSKLSLMVCQKIVSTRLRDVVINLQSEFYVGVVLS